MTVPISPTLACLNRRPNNCGFTLTELLVVMGIMVLLSVMLIPIVAPMFRGRAIAASVNQVQATILKAQGLAAASGAVYYVTFSNRDPLLHMVTIYDNDPADADSIVDAPLLLEKNTMLYFDEQYPPAAGNNGLTDGTDCFLRCLPDGTIRADGTSPSAANAFTGRNDWSNDLGITGIITIRISEAYRSDYSDISTFRRINIVTASGQFLKSDG